ncbi:hypothetical protein APHAL10511_003564 [Amanita phalloides]|nr:hypothetical protein APHAL10511_003564 [Amanita phalloides]
MQRPSTAFSLAQSPATPVYPAYDYDYEEDDEDEDEEDVFAFRPPTSAPGAPPNLPPLPSPTFDPYARFPQRPLHPPLQPPPQSPPSTASHSNNADSDPYRLRRLNTAVTTSRRPVSSREVHDRPITRARGESIVSAPISAVVQDDEEDGFDHDPLDHVVLSDSDLNIKEKRPPSIPESISITPSMLEEDATTRDPSIKMEFDLDAIEEEDSPYPEVRASVSNIDDPDMPTMTIRMWFVGLFLCTGGGALNVFFNFRSPAPTVVPLALLLVSYPMGKFLAFALPIHTYRIPLPYFSPTTSLSTPFAPLVRPFSYPRVLEFSLNPGPWNIKEHVLVYIMANVAVGSPYAINAIVTSQVYYGLAVDYWFQIVLVLATQLTGFGLAGLCRRFLVWPASMVWPQNLVACTLLNTLHAEDEDDAGVGAGVDVMGRKIRRPMTRYRFFLWVFVGSFLFFFLPGFLFQALSIFSFVCWAAPDNVLVNQLFGVHSGLGMSFLTFDWTQITWTGSPLMVPWWAQLQIFLGLVLFFWILTPILYYSNTWHLSYFPILGNDPYDRFGKVYNISRVLTKDDRFDLTAYNDYSPLFLPAAYAMTYLLAFALSTCVIVHTLLYHGRTLLNGFKRIRVEADDIHAKLMRNYPEVPDWWYASVFGVFFALAVVAVEVWKTGMPVWSLLLSVLLPVLYVLPSGFIYAMTGQGITLNILAQIIPGTLLPGNPLANMLFKAYSVQTLTEATSFVQDLKLGHYIKVPPRATFLAQLVATVLAAFVQIGVKQWIFANVRDICAADQPSLLTCPHNQVFFTASAVWGLIGPSRQFGAGSIYHPQLYAIIVGALLPLPFWLWQRRRPQSWIRWVSTPVILNGVSSIPPATGINYSSWFLVGFVFQYVIRRRNFAWWSKFNYVASAALDSGTVISLMVIFFTLQFPRGGKIDVDWWGNTVFMDTADWVKTAWKAVPDGGIVMAPHSP